jgi:uncharacterized protein (UPF0335 family)
MVPQIQSEIIPLRASLAPSKNIQYKFILTFPKISNIVSFWKQNKDRGPMADNKVIPFKKDPDFAVHNEAAVAPVREVLCTLISNLESLEMERADIVREISDNLVIARAKGFNIGAIRKILAERRRDKGELEEERAVIELYKSFLGM